MKNNYLIECFDSVSLQEKVNEIISNSDFTSSVINKYDLEEVNLDCVLEDLDTYGFLSEKKIIVVYNFDKLSIDDNSKQVTHLVKYLENFNTDNLLIITAKKFDDRKKIVKQLKKLMSVVEIDFNDEVFIKQKLKGYVLEPGVLDIIKDYCQGDITKISNECFKIMNYKFDDKRVSKDDVLELLVKKSNNSNEVVFEFVRNLAEKNKKEALKLYNQLQENQVEVYSILGLLESQFRLIYQVKLLEKQRFSNKKLADILGEKSSYRISKTKELTKYYSEKELLSMMIKLADIDLKIKSTSSDANLLMQLLILNI